MKATVRTSITVPRDIWVKLRLLADAKAAAEGTRPAMGDVVTELVEREERRPRLVKGGNDAA